MKIYNAYAARSAKTQLEPFSFDPGPLGSEEVEKKSKSKSAIAAFVIPISPCSITIWGMSKYPFVPGHEVTGAISALGEQAKGLEIGQRVGLG
jgi:alcohol/geraniol dehydrogenase (NADP+)